ncbi:MAG: chromosome segregation protein SMC [Deltaproteobacteria bacterium]|nr:chromosome segregation protein SMC [Deltaproteobacteria bacterium]
MRIKRLELCGFKSFVEPTSLEFSKGISGIVGPNGCGKSNLVDALRWVLGEQSAKRLRGDAMEDVIFNGTDSGRGPAGMAEVSLLLENEQPAVEIEEPSEICRRLRDAAEIQVTRRYFRSGESEYLINHRPCRLKDVTELFLGTGVGTKAYAMIEQGRVDQLVNARPEDIRLFIEEAAGTTLYRDRRLAAERKMERTRDNLARVSDILQEVDRNIVFYRRLAKRAEQYRQCQQELRTVELQLARRRLERLERGIAEIAERRRALCGRESELGAAIERLEGEREAARRQLDAAQRDLQARQGALFEVRTARERAQARLEMIEREEVESRAQTDRVGRDREETGARIAELRAAAEQRARTLEEWSAKNREGEQRLAACLGDVAAEERQVAALDGEVERAKTENVEVQRAESELRNRLHAARERESERRRRREQLAAEIAAGEAEVGRLAAELARMTADRSGLEERVASATEEASRVARDVAELRAEKASIEQASLAAAAALAEAESRLAAAEEVERGFGRYHEGVRAVMRRHAERPNGILNLVAQVIDTPPEFEKAVAAVLGERLQYVVVRTPQDAREAIRELKASGAGRSNFIPVEPRRPQRAEAAPAAERCTGLLDVVRVEEGYGPLAESLLGDAVLVDSLDHGLELWQRNGRWRTLVTLEGEVVYADGVVSGGSAGPYEERLLAQRREIRRLREEVERLARELADLEQRRSERAAALAAAERRSGTVDEARRTLLIERVTLGKDAERLAEDSSRARRTLERARGEDRRLEEEIAALVEGAAENERALLAAAARLASGDERRRAAEAELADRRGSLDAKNGAAMELKIALVRAREQEEALRQGQEQMRAQCRELERRLGQLEADAEASLARARGRGAERLELAAALERNAAEEAARAADVERGRAGAEALRQGLEASEHDLAGLRGELDRVRQERGGQDLAYAEHDMRREHTIGGIRERYQLELAEVTIDEAVEEEIEARFQTLQQKIDRMDRATVGLEAMEELGSMEERRAFLAKEKADLERAIADLQRTISNLNRMSRDRFAEAFAAVDEKFQQTFPRLFRGGRARLVLTDESDLMETGVDIHVQPPGMNLRTLSLLSGGQKALTAVSLIFSLFMCRPSPFCVLDEVDAPLDDANIDRFNEIVTDMGAGSQFLIITHNQRTMEVADRLYGVTMEEPGVSKIVSVRLQTAQSAA